ncbi:MAG: PD-(D/E)XK nuclease family protein [Gammaproteobacteria bacterium]|nr:PD-(D/E)XK nuclease family protein [Gammaproteobacteria bacterium]
MKKIIRQRLQQGFTLLTPTRRLSRFLHARYAASQIEQGNTVWETADILPWYSWLQRCWGDYSALYNNELLLLSTQQQQAVWQQIISSSRHADLILQPATTARQAVHAWELLHQWQLAVFPEDIYINEDARAFQSWAQEYQKRCARAGWLDETCLANVFADKTSTQQIVFSYKLALIGFDELTPQQRALLAVLKSAGCEIHELDLEKRNSQVKCAGFSDARAEIRAAANWARLLLEGNSGASIGIVVPNLQALRHQIEYCFDDVLLPASLLSRPDSIKRPFSISLGLPLGHYPIVETALLILELAYQPFSVHDIGALLRSPYIKDTDAERFKRAKLDASLRKSGEPELTINSLLYTASHYLDAEDHCSSFLACCYSLHKRIAGLPATQSPHQWAKTFSELLTIFRWPGIRMLTSAEFQTVKAWQDTLSQFASLDTVSAPLKYKAALAQLRQLANNFSFQPETAEVPVQILGMAGAAGMQFDHLWIMGLQEEVWPPPAEPNPFIPVVLQRRHKFPHATADAQLHFAQQMSTRLIDSSPDVVLSYPQNDGERPLRPSPLIYDHLQSTYELTNKPVYSTRIYNSRRFDWINDNRAPAIPAGHSVHGGATLFKDQAACPFRSFARHRLNAVGLDSLDIGLDAMDRGSLVHEVLQMLWQQLGSHQALAAKDDSELDVEIKNAVTQVLTRMQRRRNQTFTERFTQLERERLTALMHEWLAIERGRDAFRVIACEEDHTAIINDIEIKTRIDRIDQIADGRRIIIDYKIGDVKVNAWFSERPDEPQLPLYAVTNAGELAALAFARIKRGVSGFIGLADGNDIIPGIRDVSEIKEAQAIANWQELISGWKKILSQLAADFREGDARVSPKNADTCKICDLHAFCRIYEKSVINHKSQVTNEDL